MKRRTRKRTEKQPDDRNRVRLVPGGDPFFDELSRQIGAARHSIHFQTYIFGDDATGRRVAGELMEAARRGVTVCMLVDGYASKSLSDEFIGELQASGIHFRFFEPLLQSRHFYFGRRLHQKVMVFDGVRGLVSGTNIADRYDDGPHGPAWLDIAMLVEGAAAAELYQVCQDIWGRQHIAHKPLEAAAFADTIPSEERVPVRILRNDWVRRRREIWKHYLHLFNTAEESLTIMCSYFLPGRGYRKRLERAARRGVRIRVVLSGISDVPISKYAERYLYRWMLRHQIEVYEYQPTVLHAKIAVADEKRITAGSYNINDLSAYASIELNLDIHSPDLARQATGRINDIIAQDCCRITDYNDTPLFSLRQLLQFLSFQGVRLLLTLSTFYYRQHE